MKTWQDFMVTRVTGKEQGMPWNLHDKLKCYTFCDSHGIPHPEVLSVFNSPAEISFPADLDNFIIKPTLQSSTKGVMVLSKRNGGYYDSLKMRMLSVAAIIEEQQRFFDETQAPNKKIIIERKVTDIDNFEIPRDFKAYAFNGDIALILEIDRNTKPPTVCWYDGAFAPVVDGRVSSNPEFVNEIHGRRPIAWSEMLEIAKLTSRAIRSPFASIDMYNTPAGPLVGEITLSPGGLYHGKHYTLSDSQQVLMGAMWETASTALERNRHKD